MIGFSLGPVGRAVQGLNGPSVPGVVIEFLGSSAPVSAIASTYTATLPVTAQAGDIVVWAISSTGTLVSTVPTSTELATGAPRVRVMRMLGGETTVSAVYGTSTGSRHRALMFRPSVKAGILQAGAFDATATSQPVTVAALGVPAIAIVAGTHTTTTATTWIATLPEGYTVVENTPYSGAVNRALYLGYKLLGPGDTGSGTITLDVGGTVTTVTYVGVITPT